MGYATLSLCGLSERLFASNFPEHTGSVDTEGMSGAQVQGQYIGRLNQAYTKAQDELYDWIIIMGGTNDLRCGGTGTGDLRSFAWVLFSFISAVPVCP